MTTSPDRGPAAKLAIPADAVASPGADPLRNFEPVGFTPEICRRTRT